MKSGIISIFLVAIFTLLLSGCNRDSSHNNKDDNDFSKKNIKAAFVYSGTIGDAGWTYSHESARKELERNYPSLVTVYHESVPENEKSYELFRKLAKEGYKVIIGTSYGFGDKMLKVSKEYPNTIFLHCSGDKISDNMGTYFGRIYQARYLTGLVAGKMTKTNRIGYVAAFQIPEVVRGIDAFTLGVRKVNPKAKVYTVFTKTWHNPSTERKITNFLYDYGCDVLAYHQDSPTLVLIAQERGKYCIGYHTDMSIFAPKSHLVSAVWNWQVFYEKAMKEVYRGNWKPTKYWKGLKEGIVDITPLGKMVPDDVRTLVEKAKSDMAAEAYDVFDGPVKDIKGKVVVGDGEKLTDEQLWNLNFFVQGVVLVDGKMMKEMKKEIIKKQKTKSAGKRQ